MTKVQGLRHRQEQEMQKTAWAVAHLMNMWVVKGKITPQMLLGTDKKEQRSSRAYASETRAHLREVFKLKN